MNSFSHFQSKALQEAEASEIATSQFAISNDGKVIPRAVGSSSGDELERISSLVMSYGSSILTRKLDGVMGDLSHYKGNEAANKVLEGYNLTEMASKLASDLITKGSAGLAIGKDPFTDEPYLMRLGGFIHKLTAKNDVDNVIGIVQMTQPDGKNWDVRIYSGDTVAYWSGVRNISRFVPVNPEATYENDVKQVAFFADYMTDDVNSSIGEMEQLAPLIKAIMAVEARTHRVSEIFGYPRPIISGTVIESAEHSPTDAIYLSEGGSVKYLTPADFNNLLNQKKDLLNSLDKVAIIPAGFSLSGNPPSGEALKNANAEYNNSIRKYAGIISKLMTDAFKELFELFNVDTEDFYIRLIANPIVDDAQDLTDAIALLDRSLLPVAVVVQLIQKRFDGFTEEQAKEVIASYQSTSLNSEAIAGLIR